MADSSTREGFIFYRSFYDSIKELPRDIQGEVLTAIIEYGLNGATTENLKPEHRIIIDADPKSYNIERIFHWNWKGGVTSDNQIIRNSARMKAWRRSVFQRDNYTCQHCGKIGGHLNAHHIKPYYLFVQERFELSNGLTLCKSCHKTLHKTERPWQ